MPGNQNIQPKNNHFINSNNNGAMRFIMIFFIGNACIYLVDFAEFFYSVYNRCTQIMAISRLNNLSFWLTSTCSFVFNFKQCLQRNRRKEQAGRVYPPPFFREKVMQVLQ